MIRAKAAQNTTAWVLFFKLQAHSNFLYESLLFGNNTMQWLLYELLLLDLQAHNNLLYE